MLIDSFGWALFGRTWSSLRSVSLYLYLYLSILSPTFYLCASCICIHLSPHLTHSSYLSLGCSVNEISERLFRLPPSTYCWIAFISSHCCTVCFLESLRFHPFRTPFLCLLVCLPSLPLAQAARLPKLLISLSLAMFLLRRLMGESGGESHLPPTLFACLRNPATIKRLSVQQSFNSVARLLRCSFVG